MCCFPFLYLLYSFDHNTYTNEYLLYTVLKGLLYVDIISEIPMHENN